MPFRRVQDFDAQWDTAEKTGVIALHLDDVGVQELPLGPAEYQAVIALLVSGKRVWVDENFHFTTRPV